MNPSLRPYLAIAIMALAVYLPFLGAVHLFDWDEINFAESAREMLVSQEYFQVQINYMPFWEKPPLFIWMQAFSMKIFGVNEFAARFPNVINGLLTLLLIFRLGKDYFGSRMAWYWVLAYAGSLTPQLYFKSGIIDPFFNLFIFLSLVMIAKASILEKKQRKKFYFFGGLFLGLALLTKGPASVVIVGLCILTVLALRSFKFYFDWLDILLYCFSTLLVAFAWYGVEFLRHGLWFFQEFIRYQTELASQSVATHGQPWYYHPLVLLFGAFPASVVALRTFGENLTWTDEQKNLRRWMAVLFWVVLIVFSIVKTKIIHYSSLCYLPLTFMAAMVIDSCHVARIQYRRSNVFMILIIGLTLSLAFLAIPSLAGTSLKGWLIDQMKDPFAAANMELPVSWPWFSWIPGALMLFSLLLAIYLLWIQRWRMGFPVLFLGSLFSLQSFLLLDVPRIERYTQGPAIDFFEQLKEKDVYVETLGYKSYAQYFYSQIPQIGDTASYQTYCDSTLYRYVNANTLPGRDIPNQQFKDWLMNGKIDKPAYFVSKITEEKAFATHPNLEVIGRKGGFVFYKRVEASHH
ncbi:MAG: glycosyltransferase family 39 protein [Bacteroidetes bacterium]|nr:glycosyltransferase family 39 protein [Bacteroidota bacterium]